MKTAHVVLAIALALTTLVTVPLANVSAVESMAMDQMVAGTRVANFSRDPRAQNG